MAKDTNTTTIMQINAELTKVKNVMDNLTISVNPDAPMLHGNIVKQVAIAQAEASGVMVQVPVVNSELLGNRASGRG